MSNKNKYSAQSIQVQEGLEAVRKRPGMYIGSVDVEGLHHLVYEIVDNSIDEALAGFCDTITVTLYKDNSVSVSDNGRGIPVDTHSDGKSALEIVMTKLHAGGKFSKDAYKISGGLHGVGCAVVNALSQWCVATIHQKPNQYQQRYQQGNVASEITTIENTDLTGTFIHFLPDAGIFEETQEFNREKLANRFKELAFLIPDITINLIDERSETPTSASFSSKKGIIDFVHTMGKKHILESPIFFHEIIDSKEVTKIEFAFNYATGQDSVLLTFVNTIHTREGGSHLEGLKSALTKTFNRLLKTKNYEKIAKMLKNETLQGVDVQAGIQAVFSIHVVEPTFSGQTKTKLSNREVRGIVESLISESLTQHLDHHPKETQKILEKCVQSALARIEGQKAYDNTLRKGPLSSTSLPGKLTDCAEKDPAKSEIFLVEGDSAGGSAKTGRDSNTQAILPLFGKPSNVEKMQNSLSKIQTNAKLHPIIASLGTNIGELFNIQKLRYHKVILMADADIDGSHIRTLWLAFFFRYMRGLIEAGHVYMAMPPLFYLSWGGKKDFSYVYNEKELANFMKTLEEKQVPKNKIKIRRYKGLGEMNAQELWDTTMNPESRHIMQITLEDIISADKTFTLLLGEEVEPRKRFIEENALKVINLDV